MYHIGDLDTDGRSWLDIDSFRTPIWRDNFQENKLYNLVTPELLLCDIELEIVFLFYC